MRSTHDMIRFKQPVCLPEIAAVQPAGTYMVVTDEEDLPGLSLSAWHRVSTQIHLPAIGEFRGREQVTDIDPKNLASAMMRDTSVAAE